MQTKEQLFCEEYIQEVLKNPDQNLHALKITLAAKHKIKRVPKNPYIVMHAPKEDMNKLITYLRPKPIRKLSGVTVVALFAKPHHCPHGSCTYCPGGPGSPFGDVPKSYTGEEPAAMRAKRNDYDPYFQVFNRLEHYIMQGHLPDKIEIILMGGTFPSLDKPYRDEFIMYMYKAFNDFGELFLTKDRKVDYEAFKEFFELPHDVNDETAKQRIFERMRNCKEQHVKHFKQEINRNEQAKIRCIGLTIETKPDWALFTHCTEMLSYGATRIEVGVQTLDNDILIATNRGHTLKETKECFQIMKDLCFKINAHMMLGLPDSTREKDITSIKELFTTPDYNPDMLKLYPTLVIKGTKLYGMYKRGVYTPVSTKEAADRICEAFKYIPKYVRVMRIQRDIPTTLTHDGVRNSNLRQVVEEELKKRNIVSKDIRAREIGLVGLQNKHINQDFSVKIEAYDSCGGKEFFISYENKDDVLIGFVRLRFPGKQLLPQITDKTAFIRELHVYGNVAGVGDKASTAHQHKGVGKLLMQTAEDIAIEHGYKKIIVISGIGVREYYRKLGYKLEDPYMAKQLPQ